MPNTAMKTLAVIGALAAFPHFVIAQQPGQGGQGIRFLPQNRPAPGSNSITDDELRQRQKSEKFAGISPEITHGEAYNVETFSEFIAFDGNVTLVPKGAILFVPEKMRANILSKPTGNFLVWTDFIVKYRAVINAFEVSIEQATGQKPIDPARLEAARRSGLIVVAVLSRSPITVRQQTQPTGQR